MTWRLILDRCWAEAKTVSAIATVKTVKNSHVAHDKPSCVITRDPRHLTACKPAENTLKTPNHVSTINWS